MSEEGYKFPESIKTEGVKEHFRTLNSDVSFAAKEFKKVDMSASICLYTISDAIQEGSTGELLDYVEAFIADRQMRIQEGSWPYKRSLKGPSGPSEEDD